MKLLFISVICISVSLSAQNMQKKEPSLTLKKDTLNMKVSNLNTLPKEKPKTTIKYSLQSLKTLKCMFV